MVVAELIQKLICCPQDAIIVIEVNDDYSKDSADEIITTLTNFAHTPQQFITLYLINKGDDFTVPSLEVRI
jgi:hypothetical protein